MTGNRSMGEYRFGVEDIGRVLYRERHRPGPVALAVLVTAPLLVPLIFRDDVTSVGIFLFYYLGGTAFVALIYMSGWMNRITIHEHAVVLDHSWPGGKPYVIPFSTIDLNRIRYHLRANFIGRRLRQGRRTMRVAPYMSRAITFDGLSPRVAVRRTGHSAEGVERTADRLLRALEDALVTDGHVEAGGMADDRLTHPVVERWRQPLTDEEIYPDRR